MMCKMQGADFTGGNDLLHALKALSKRRLKPTCSLTPAFSTTASASSIDSRSSASVSRKDMFARIGSVLMIMAWAGCWRDQHCLDLRINEQLAVVALYALDAQLVRQRLGDIQADIADGGKIGFWNIPRKVSHMDAAHASGPNDGDVDFLGHLIPFYLAWLFRDKDKPSSSNQGFIITFMALFGWWVSVFIFNPSTLECARTVVQ